MLLILTFLQSRKIQELFQTYSKSQICKIIQSYLNMFQPNSIRSLLSKRSTNKFETQHDPKSTNKNCDPDIDSILETKLMIKDVDHQIQSIREWKQQQKLLTNQKLKCNEDLKNVEIEEHFKYSKRQEERDQQQHQKMMKKMTTLQSQVPANIQTNENNTAAAQPQQQMDIGNTNIYDFIHQSDMALSQLKHEQYQVNDHHEAFINSVSSINDIFSEKMNKQNKKGKGVVDKKFIDQELAEIDQQLKEIQELLKD